MEIKIVRKLMKINADFSAQIRSRLAQYHIPCFNIISAPGSGKTALLESTIEDLRDKYSILVLEGDIATTRDAQRIQKHNVPVIQLLTEGSCHLDAHLIWQALDSMDISPIRIIFIENVGNLVCPAEFDIGERYKIAVLSVPEGDDKVLKYPKLFHDAAAVILNKIDLLPYLDFDKNRFYEDIRKINPQVPVFELSSRTGEGLDDWLDFLESKIKYETKI